MSSQPSTWTGEHPFDVTGSGLHEDTLRIAITPRQSEKMLSLILPTLCVTYADMAFQNAVGGQQRNYPASSVCGLRYFDPPIVLAGSDIEKYTYIRGAHQVEIGPRETIVRFRSRSELVVPRLRIDPSGARARIAADGVVVHPETPFRITVKQYSDGRHCGGVTIEKRHPAFVDPVVPQVYDLWIHVVDGRTGRPLQEVAVERWHWDAVVRSPDGPGDFALAGRHFTNAHGVVEVHGLPAGVLQWYTVSNPGWRVAPRCLRPLPGQRVRLQMNAWPMRRDAIRYVWKRVDSLKAVAALAQVAEDDVLKANGLASAGDLSAGMAIMLPCYHASYRPESWDKPSDLALRFGFRDPETLARANGLHVLKSYAGAVDLELPDWQFFCASAGDSLGDFDRRFATEGHAVVPAHRVFRPRRTALLGGEVVAVPEAPRKVQRLTDVSAEVAGASPVASRGL